MKEVFYSALLLALLLTCGCRAGREAGRADACRDLSRGILGLESYGRHAPYISDEYWPVLKQRYGIRVIDHGCIVDERTIQHVEGYNEVMDVEMTRRFGSGFWKPVMEQARASYAARQKPSK